MKKNNLITIIIANYNGEKYLQPCLDSLMTTYYKNYEIIVIDDASTDKSVSIIKKYKKVFLLRNKTNKGAAESRNIAARKAKGKILLFLDNDTQVRANSVTELIKPIDKNSHIAATQSLIIDYHDRDKIQMAGGKLIKQVFWLEPFNQNESYSKNINIIKSRDIIGISACMAVKKDVFEKINGFSSLLGVYTEDIDFCLKIWSSGFRVVLAPKSLVYHWTKTVAERKNMNAYLGQIYFNLAKNSWISIFANYELVNLLKYLPISMCVNMIRAAYVLLKKGSFAAIVGTAKAFFWFIINISLILNYRQQIQRHRKVSDKLLFNRVFSNKSLLEIYRNYYL